MFFHVHNHEDHTSAPSPELNTATTSHENHHSLHLPHLHHHKNSPTVPLPTPEPTKPEPEKVWTFHGRKRTWQQECIVFVTESGKYEEQSIDPYPEATIEFEFEHEEGFLVEVRLSQDEVKESPAYKAAAKCIYVRH